jgi:hypothetical protein
MLRLPFDQRHRATSGSLASNRELVINIVLAFVETIRLSWTDDVDRCRSAKQAGLILQLLAQGIERLG